MKEIVIDKSYLTSKSLLKLKIDSNSYSFIITESLLLEIFDATDLRQKSDCKNKLKKLANSSQYVRGIGHLLHEEFEQKVPIGTINEYFLNFNKEGKIKLLNRMDKREDVRQSFYRVNEGTKDISLGWFNDYIGNIINIIPEIENMDISDENKVIACDIVTNEVKFFKRCEKIFPDIPNSLLSFFSVVGRKLQAYTLRSIEYYFKNNRQKIKFSNYNMINSMYDLDYAVMGCFFDGIATRDKDLQIIYNQMNNGEILK